MTVQLDQGIRLLSGALFNYNDPGACHVEISDIAAALSKVCRFAGHIHQFYSVAQHAVNTSLIVAPEYAFDALMHDTAEAFTNDIPTPLKYAVPMFKELEVRIEAAMAERFGFRYPLHEAIKTADLQMLGIEKVLLKRDMSNWGVLEAVEWDHIAHLVDLNSWTPEMAYDQFMWRYRQLTGAQ